MKLLRWLLHPVVLGVAGLLALSALVWWIGPLVAIGESRPLGGLWARVVVVALLWLAGAARLAFGLWRRKSRNAKLVEGIAAGPSAADREAQQLAERFNEALARLRKSARRSVLEPAAYLYELPWYVFVGAPGSGKTTALTHAGLQFLLDGDQAEPAAVRGVGGTRNCDWWFTKDAVLIDTAGRYATQDSDREVDASAWDRFLALLKKTRPRQPINGVLLTVNVQDLLQQGAPERAEHARRLRARVHELQQKLGVRAPIYVLVTKADLIAGFDETFGTLPKEARDQVWGFTFAADAPAGADPLQGFDAEYRLLEEQLGAALPDRLAAERDPARRAAQFGFLQEFAALRAPLADFLRQVFSEGTKGEAPPLVRGVYFTSGTQEGTPIDRVMGALSRSFGLDRRGKPFAGGLGKSYFLHRLLHDLVFVERGLVAFDAAAEKRRRALRWAGAGAVGVAAVAVLAGWAVSWSRNKAYAEQVAARVPALQQSLAALPPAPAGDVTLLPQPLAQVRDAALPADFPVDDPPLLATLGLYQGDKLDAAAKLAYRRLLERALMPRVARRLEERLRAASRDNLEAAYESLKAYLMLHTPDKFDAETLKAWIGVDWDAQFARTLAPEQRAQLDAHLAALLEGGAPAPAAPMDRALVASVRDMLVAFPLEFRIYSRLKRQSSGNESAEFSVARAAGPQAAQVFERASREPLTRGIPGLYTRDGYQKTFQASVQKASIQLAAEEPWVLGMRPSNADLKSGVLGGELGNRVRRLYLEDYVKHWERYLADVRLVRIDSLARGIEVARLLAAVDSPLAAFLRAASAETTLVPPAAPPSSPVAALAGRAQAARDEAARLAGAQPAPATGPGSAGQPIERIVDDRFASLHRLFQGQPAPIEEQGKLFNELFLQLSAIDSAQKSKSPPPPAQATERLKAAAGQQPEPVRSIVEALADAGAKQGRAAERDVLSAELKPITDFCLRSIANRYPFAAGSNADVLPEDFGQLFGAGGMLDDFYQRRLASLVDTSRASWSYKPLADGSVPATPAALAEFQRAARIREVYFRGGGKTPGFRIDLRPVQLDEGLTEVTIDIDGQPIKFAAGSTSAATIAWPPQRVASQIRVSSSAGGAPLVFEGPWALFRMFDRFEVQPGAQPEKFTLVMNLAGKRARFEATANSVFNPFRLREMQQFRCPGAL